jgi:hypothetical protein
LRFARILHRPWDLVTAFAAVVAMVSLMVAPPHAPPSGDERDYLRAAAHLARSGVFSHAELAPARPAPDAYREPGYSFLLALGVRIAGVAPPEHEGWLRTPGWPEARPVVRALGTLLLVLSAGATGCAVRFAGAARVAGLAAAALVLASPALRQAAVRPGSEGLAAALVALAGCALVVATRSRAQRVAVLAGCAIGLGALARAAGLVLVPVGALILLLAPGEPVARRRRLALFLLCALLPPALWGARNTAATGHFLIADRGGQVLWTRAELDRQIAREGVGAALATWTPVERVRAFGRDRWPEASFARYAWTGEGNFFTRSLRAWRAARTGSADPLAVDREFGRAALRQFLTQPFAHAAASVAVAWRGLFAEGSPAVLVPLDLTLACGLLLAAGILAVALRALRRRDVAALALAAVPLALFLFHATFTEYLPRFGVPALPLAWGALALALAPGGGKGEAG